MGHITDRRVTAASATRPTTGGKGPGKGWGKRGTVRLRLIVDPVMDQPDLGMATAVLRCPA